MTFTAEERHTDGEGHNCSESLQVDVDDEWSTLAQRNGARDSVRNLQNASRCLTS